MSTANLSVETNLNMYNPDILYILGDGPLSGLIHVGDQQKNSFTQQGELSFMNLMGALVKFQQQKNFSTF